MSARINIRTRAAILFAAAALALFGSTTAARAQQSQKPR